MTGQLGAGSPTAATPPAAAPAATTQRIKDLGDLIAAAGPAVNRDPLVRELRDLVVKVWPQPAAEARKTIEKAINDGVAEGIKAAIKAGLDALVGKSATPVSPDAPPQYGPNVPQKDLGEHIIKTPSLPLPFDKPPEYKTQSYEFHSVNVSYKPGESINFSVRTPSDYVPMAHGASRVALVEVGDLAANGKTANKLVSKEFHDKGSVSMSIQAPDTEGRYVLVVLEGLDAPRDPSREFAVAKQPPAGAGQATAGH